MQNKSLDIDFSDYRQLLDLMNRADEFSEMLFGENDYGERVHTSIYKDKIITETFQTNNWIRINTFEINGDDIIISESFER